MSDRSRRYDLSRTTRLALAAAAALMPLSATPLAAASPAAAVADSAVWIQVSALHNHTCAIRDDGRAFCWGLNSTGQLGNGTTESAARPVEVAGGRRWKWISAGSAQTCGVATDGRGYCWGRGKVGQLGNGAWDDHATPVEVAGGHRWTQIAAGNGFNCGIATDGRAYCWGAGENGELGNGGTANHASPVPVAGDRNWRRITAADYHACGITAEGRAYCWGQGKAGRLGSGSDANLLVPGEVRGGKRWSRLSAGRFHTCGITTDREAYCWGWAERGQLGVTYGVKAVGSPLQVASPQTLLGELEVEWADISAGAWHTCAVTATGEAYCWGDGRRGRLGDGEAGPSGTASPVAGNGRWTALAASQFHTCGILDDGQLYCWGVSNAGQLGNGTTADRHVPVSLAGTELDVLGGVKAALFGDAKATAAEVAAEFERRCGIRVAESEFGLVYSDPAPDGDPESCRIAGGYFQNEAGDSRRARPIYERGCALDDASSCVGYAWLELLRWQQARHECRQSEFVGSDCGFDAADQRAVREGLARVRASADKACRLGEERGCGLLNELEELETWFDRRFRNGG